MSFNFMLKGSTAKVQHLQIRKEVVTTKSAAHSRIPLGPQRLDVPNTPKVNAKKAKRTASGKASRSSPDPPRVQKRAPVKRRTPSEVTPAFSSDGSDGEESPERPAKRVKQEVQHVDPKRQVRCRQAFSENNSGELAMVHAADITLLDGATKYVPAFEGVSDSDVVSLQYPSVSPKERYTLPPSLSDPFI